MMTDYHAIDARALMRPKDFTGFWEAHWPNGQLKYRGHFVNGVEVGQQVCYWQDGTIAQVSWRDPDGFPRGTTVSYSPEGDKETEETWDDDSRHPGTFVRRSYDASGDLTSVTRFCEFHCVESWERPEENPDPERDAMIDQIVANAIKSVVSRLESDDDEDDELDAVEDEDERVS